jgi:hypothetical protein
MYVLFLFIFSIGLYKKARAGIIKGFTGIDQENINKLQFSFLHYIRCFVPELIEADPGP